MPRPEPPMIGRQTGKRRVEELMSTLLERATVSTNPTVRTP
jgi:hypothetical protein